MDGWVGINDVDLDVQYEMRLEKGGRETGLYSQLTLFVPGPRKSTVEKEPCQEKI